MKLMTVVISFTIEAQLSVLVLGCLLGTMPKGLKHFVQ